MNIVLVLLGVLILIVTYADFIYTTLSTSGSGKLSRFLTGSLWKALFLLSGKRGSSRLLSYAGIVCTVLLLGSWISLIWIGNSLIFCAFPDSIRSTETKQIATIVEKFYFIGCTLSTAGFGDYHPTTAGWKLMTVLVGFSGLSMLSLAITYLLQVLSAELEKKRLSLYITSLGESPQQILLNSWNGKDFTNLDSVFSQLSVMILSHSQHHLAYPLLRHFHTRLPSESTALTLTCLDEVLSILLSQIPARNRPKQIVLTSLHRVLSNYILTLEKDFIQLADKPLAMPLVDQLQASAIPMQTDSRVEDEQLFIQRRKLLQAILEASGWSWHDLNQPKGKQEGIDFIHTIDQHQV